MIPFIQKNKTGGTYNWGQPRHTCRSHLCICALPFVSSRLMALEVESRGDMRPWSDTGSDTSGLPVLWSHEADFLDVLDL